MDGCKWTVHTHCCHRLATIAAFTAKATVLRRASLSEYNETGWVEPNHNLNQPCDLFQVWRKCDVSLDRNREEDHLNLEEGLCPREAGGPNETRPGRGEKGKAAIRSLPPAQPDRMHTALRNADSCCAKVWHHIVTYVFCIHRTSNVMRDCRLLRVGVEVQFTMCRNSWHFEIVWFYWLFRRLMLVVAHISNVCTVPIM